VLVLVLSTTVFVWCDMVLGSPVLPSRTGARAAMGGGEPLEVGGCCLCALTMSNLTVQLLSLWVCRKAVLGQGHVLRFLGEQPLQMDWSG
jgi:hypothetical protein